MPINIGAESAESKFLLLSLVEQNVVAVRGMKVCRRTIDDIYHIIHDKIIYTSIQYHP